jgi:hypothetical protein
MSFTGDENHGITLNEAAQLTANYRASHPASTIKGFFYGKQAIMGILTQEKCVGIRIYYAQDLAGNPTMVITGVDENENDLYQGQLAEFGQPCPTRCSVANPLNS